MKIKTNITIQRLIGKIDNDFNLSESDWIPRVAAWTIDALSQMKVLPMERKRRTLEVSDRLAQFPCELNATEIKVYDKNGCEIQPITDETSCCGNRINQSISQQEIAVIDTTNKTGVNFMNVVTIPNGNINRGFVLQGNCIELNFETDLIQVETYEVATYHDDYFDCDVPYIYDDGLLLEALAWYCLFKYLSRGSHHQVYSITSPNQVVNPYYQWINLKSKAAASVRIKISKDLNGWRNFFYNSTFMPRG